MLKFALRESIAFSASAARCGLMADPFEQDRVAKYISCNVLSKDAPASITHADKKNPSSTETVFIGQSDALPKPYGHGEEELRPKEFYDSVSATSILLSLQMTRKVHR